MDYNAYCNHYVVLDGTSACVQLLMHVTNW